MSTERWRRATLRTAGVLAAIAIAALGHIAFADDPNAEGKPPPSQASAKTPRAPKPAPPTPAKPAKPRGKAFQPSEKIPADVSSAIPTDI